MDIQQKRQLKRFKNSFSKFLDPFVTVLLLAIFTLPILTVVSLNPKLSPNIPKFENVLGTNDAKLDIKLVGGSHGYISTEALLPGESANQYVYSSEIRPHEEGNFSKPILKFINNTDTAQKYKVYIKTYSGNAQLNLFLDDVRYKLRDTDGELSIVEITSPANSNKELYFGFYSREVVNFSNSLVLTITPVSE